MDPEIDWRPEWGGCLSVMLLALLLPTVETVGPQCNRMESCQRDDLTNSLQKKLDWREENSKGSVSSLHFSQQTILKMEIRPLLEVSTHRL